MCWTHEARSKDTMDYVCRWGKMAGFPGHLVLQALGCIHIVPNTMRTIALSLPTCRSQQRQAWWLQASQILGTDLAEEQRAGGGEQGNFESQPHAENFIGNKSARWGFLSFFFFFKLLVPHGLMVLQA